MIRYLRAKWQKNAEARRIVAVSAREVKRLKAADKARDRAERLRGIV